MIRVLDTRFTLTCRLRERKDIFIKNHIPKDVNPVNGSIKTLVSFVRGTVTYERTLPSSEAQLLIIIGTQIGPTSTAKHAS
jgi:hypothetical protein